MLCRSGQKRRGAVSKIERKSTAVDTITGLHSAIIEFEKRLSIPPFQIPSAADICSDKLASLLQHLPIQVVRSRGPCYRCIGQFRLYRLATTLLEKKATIAVEIVHQRLKREMLEERYLNEVFYLPALIGLSDADIQRLYSIWNRLDVSRKDALFPSTASFSRMLGVSTHRLRNE